MPRTRSSAFSLRFISRQFILCFAILIGLLLLAVQAFGQGSGFVLPHVASHGVGVPEAAASGHLPVVQLNFAPAVTYGSGGYGAISVAVADVDGDGKPDLVVANQCANINKNNCTEGIVSVLLGDGDGTFKAASTYNSGGPNPVSIVVADVNGDSKLDLVLANGCPPTGCTPNATVSVLLGNGDGTFKNALSYDSGGLVAQSAVVADVNGDGKPDLVVANQCNSTDNCALDGVVGVLLGNGDGTFQNVVTYDAGGLGTFWLAVADLNGDGKPDVVVANYCGSSPYPSCTEGGVAVLLGNGDGTFQNAVAYASGGYEADSVAVADVNGDGKPDIVVANYCGSSGDNCTNAYSTVGVLLGNGDGTFQPALTYAAGGESTMSVVVADVNGDSKPDVVVANQCTNITSNCASGGVAVLPGNGDGTFQSAAEFDTGGQGATSVAVADANGDGKLDLLASNYCGDSLCATTGSVGVLISTSSSAATTTTALVSSLNPSAFGQTVTFVATVTSTSGTPTGVASFFDGTTNLGNPALNSNGVATLATSALSVGTNSVKATYSGDANFAPSTSSVLSQMVQGGVGTLTPASLTFPNQDVGTTSLSQSVTLANIGNDALTITSIAISGTNSADFAPTNNCGSSVAANSNCIINVTFTPSAVGTRSASLRVSDNGPGSPHVVTLIGGGVGPVVSLSLTSITFPGQYVGTSGLPQNVTLTNAGTAALTISSVITSPVDFGNVSACGSSVAPGANCTIGVFFDPTMSGTRAGTLTITDNAGDSPQTVALNGTGQDFTVASSSSTSATISPGQTATYTLTVSPGGGFNQSVTFTCAGAPTPSTCTVSPSSVALGTNTAIVTVSVVTTSAHLQRLTATHGASLGFWLAFSVVPAMVLLKIGGRFERAHMLALLCVLAFGFTLSGCGGGSNSGGGSGGGGTRPGTYQLVVSGAFTTGSTTLIHNTTLTLIVK